MVLKIEAAESGNVFSIHEESSIEKVKYELSLHQQISPQDQILLYGPPFKVLDPHYTSTLDLSGKRIFLFDKKIVFDSTVAIPSFQLPAYDKYLYDAEKELIVTNSSSYIEYLQSLLTRTKLYELFISESLSSFRKCRNQLQVQNDAMAAAIENMKSIFFTNSNLFLSLQDDFGKLKQSHEDLFRSFESNLLDLKLKALPPQIIDEFKSKGFLDSDIPLTLYDCIPIDRERMYFKQCRETHQKVIENFDRSVNFYKSLSERVEAFSEPGGNVLSLDIIEAVEVLHQEQGQDMTFLRDVYQLVYNSSRSKVGEMQTDVVKIEESKTFLMDPAFLLRMKERCRMIADFKSKLEEQREINGKSLMRVLREIAAVQTDVQFKLKKEMEWIKKWINAGGDGYFRHLCQISELPVHFEELLQEIRRRNRYNARLKGEIQGLKQRVEERRKDEILCREIFMKKTGINLPPIFLTLMPSLKDKPPAINFEEETFESLPDLEEVNPNYVDTMNNELEKGVMVGVSLLQTQPEVVVLEDKSRETQLHHLKTIQHDLSEIQRTSHFETNIVENEILSVLQNISTTIETRKLPVITFMDFQVGDVALFMPAFVNNARVWMAFNSGYPYRFLSEKSLAVFLKKARGKEQRASIIGKITHIEANIAAEDTVSEYNIPLGTRYYICHATPLYRHKVIGPGATKDVDSKVEEKAGESATWEIRTKAEVTDTFPQESK